MTNSLIADRNRFAILHPEKTYLVNGRQWHGIRIGDTGPALVLIPGTLGRSDIFWQQMEALERHARILSLSYPASGGIEDWSEDIALLIQQHALEGAVILGSSLGGYTAQYTAAKHPGIIQGLVAANTFASVSGIKQKPPYSLDLMNVPINELRAGFTTGLSGWCDGQNPYEKLAELLLLEVGGRIPEMEMRTRLNALKEASELPPQTLSASRIWTVESEDDHLITAQMRAEVRQALNPGRSFIFEAASHFPYVTKPEAYTALLEEVLNLPSRASLPQKEKVVHL
ncbi:MAG: alpha/beta hydrolase [Sneathiella sp.]